MQKGGSTMPLRCNDVTYSFSLGKQTRCDESGAGWLEPHQQKKNLQHSPHTAASGLLQAGAKYIHSAVFVVPVRQVLVCAGRQAGVMAAIIRSVPCELSCTALYTIPTHCAHAQHHPCACADMHTHHSV